jgi:hypothetical protein
MKPRAKTAAVRSTPPSKWSTHGSLVVLALAMLVSGAVRLRLADVPLERDEGEYAYAGQLILQGVAPYDQAYNMKFPGAYYAYALVMTVFGQTARGIHLGLLVVNAITMVLLFVLGRRLIGPMAAAIGAAVFATLALDRWILGVFAHATHFVLVPALAGLILIAPAQVQPRFLRLAAAGVCFGVAILMKQQAAAYVVVAMAWVLWRGLRASRSARRDAWRAAGTIAAGAAVPVLLLVIVLAAQGVLGRFWFWTVQYASQYAAQVPLSDAWPAFQMGWGQITKATGWLWLLAGLGGVALIFGKWSRETRGFIAMLALASAAAIAPGFYFRQHYFVLALPVAGLLAGVAFEAIARGTGRLLSPAAGYVTAGGAIALAIGLYAFPEREYLARMTPQAVSRSVYFSNPFVEAPEIGRYLREHTQPGDRIAVLGSEPEIYFYAGRRSATGYIYTYALMEPQSYASHMQAEMIEEIEAAQPKFIVGVLVPMSWLVRPGSDRRILSWFDQYTRSCYEIVGAVEVGSEGAGTFRWDGDVTGFVPRSANVLYVHRRKTDTPCSVGR